MQNVKPYLLQAMCDCHYIRFLHRHIYIYIQSPLLCIGANAGLHFDTQSRFTKVGLFKHGLYSTH